MFPHMYIGVDLGGTNIKAALINGDGKIIMEQSTPTGLPRPAESVCDDIADLCSDMIAGSDVPVLGVGIGCPGTIDGSYVLYSNNLDWHDFDMGSYLTQKIHLPVFIANDANVAAFGEAQVGCAKGSDSAVIITLGTGVGGGVVINGRLIVGYTGAASEPGHMVINDSDDAPLCTCGRRGCLEAYASATALIRMTKETASKHPSSALATFVNAQEKVTGKTAFDVAEIGDPFAVEIVQTYIHSLAVGIANLINIFFPEVIGLSGGVANQGEKILVPLREEVYKMVFGYSYAKKQTKITMCRLGYKAGIIGAALYAKQQLGD